MRIYIPQKVKEKGLQGSLLKLKDIPSFPPETYLLVEETAARVGNTVVLSYSLNAAISSFYGNISAYRMNYDKAMVILRTAVENSCVLHSVDLEVSASHMEKELVNLKVMDKKQRLLEADPATLDFARKYVRLASFWRKNGGKGSWKGPERRILKDIVDVHGDELHRVFAAISATRSVSAPFIAAMDSVATPLAQGAL